MKTRLLLCFTGLAFVLIASSSIYWYKRTTRNAVEQLIHENRMINILIAGSSQYREGKHRFFAILTLNPENRNLGLTFVPPRYRMAADKNDGSEVAVEELTMDAFSEIRSSILKDLKIDIPFYIELYPPDVERIVNLIEGIELFPVADIEGGHYTDPRLKYYDGKLIMDYIHDVRNNSIYEKYDRIQDIILSLFHKKDELKKFIEFSFVSQLMHGLRTNLLAQESLAMAEVLSEPGSFYSILMPGSMENNFYRVDEIAAKIYEQDFIHRIVINDGTERTAKIKILNGTGQPGLARRMRSRLIREGLSVVEFGTADNTHVANSIIISRKGDYEAAKKVADITGIKKIYHKSDSTVFHNVLILLGRDQVK